MYYGVICLAAKWIWSEWSKWGECSGKCSLGDQLRYRTCNPPGAACEGKDVESRACVCNNQFNAKGNDEVDIHIIQTTCSIIIVVFVIFIIIHWLTISIFSDCDNDAFIQNKLGYLPDLCDCKYFYQCELVNGQWLAHHRRCAPCTRWDQSVVTCVQDNDGTCSHSTKDPNENIHTNGGKEKSHIKIIICDVIVIYNLLS